MKRFMEEQRVYVSMVSFWEIAAKRRINKINVSAQDVFDAIINPLSRIDVLRLSERALFALELLPVIEDHRDPFDHLLISQALAHRLTMISADGRFRRYPRLDLMAI